MSNTVSNDMDIENTKLENFLKNILLRNITISTRSKVIKRGKFLLFKQNGYSVDFHINCVTPTKTKIVICNLPIPFGIRGLDLQNTEFDYRVCTLAGSNPQILNSLLRLTPVSKNKFYDTIINIEAI